MLRWLSLTSVLTASFATFLVPPQESNHAGEVLRQCHGRAWVRAPDMAPGEVIAGDVKIKLIGLCPNAESYTLGLRYKEKISWKLKQEKKDWMEYIFKDEWSVHEEERIAFEIETDLVGDEGGDSLPTDFITRFGILVPNTNYPPGINYHSRQWPVRFLEGRHDSMWSDSVYEYFVKIRFSNGTTSEIPAGITSFIPFYLPTPTEREAPANLSLTRQGQNLNLKPDMLQSNYTVGVSFLDGAHVYQDSFANISAIVHRSGYTNRTDTPIRLCASLQLDIEWHPQELKNRPLLQRQQLSALVPSRSLAHSAPITGSSCREINFTEAVTDVTREGYVSSTFSEPLLLSFYANYDIVPDFSTYYLKLGHHLNVNLHIELGSSVPWMDESEKQRWERERERWESRQMDIDWVPWPLSMGPAPPRPQFLAGQTDTSVVPTQKQGPVRPIPVHYLSDEARQPLFFDPSGIDSLRLMSLEERDLIAPIAQPSLKVFDEAEELGNRYFHKQMPIYVGNTWANKVLPTIVDGHRADGVGHSFVVQ